MKRKCTNVLQNTHWTTKFIVKFGTFTALLLLLFGFLTERGSFLTICIGRTAVYLFSISTIGGILLDVIAERKGMREE